jgi:hydrogenase assembly chaperone HypC/HupF
MIFAVLGRVTAVDASGAQVETDGQRGAASLSLVRAVSVGDWVIVAAGMIIERLDPEKADAIRAELRARAARTDRTAEPVRRPRPVTESPVGSADLDGASRPPRA